MTQTNQIRRLIFDAPDGLEGRGEPPRGWTTAAYVSDLIMALKDFPETVITVAAQTVRAARTRQTWPLVGEFVRECKNLMGGEPAPVSSAELDAVARTERADDYARRRLLADSSALWHRVNAGGRFRVPEFRRWLISRACDQLRAGAEAHVSDRDIERWLADYDQPHPSATAPQATDTGEFSQFQIRHNGVGVADRKSQNPKETVECGGVADGNQKTSQENKMAGPSFKSDVGVAASAIVQKNRVNTGVDSIMQEFEI